MKGRSGMNPSLTHTSLYLCNPDVVLREESEVGGLLFNPDTNQVKVVNATGLYIWKQCDGTHNQSDITTALMRVFEEVPVDAVTVDVQEFLEDMIKSGFIGTVSV
jgi:hypothetical protein